MEEVSGTPSVPGVEGDRPIGRDPKYGHPIRKGEPLQAHETILVRGRVYRVAGFNAYGDAMLSEVKT